MTVLEKRLELHEKLCAILGSRNVYFEPPASVNMKYPAIRYSRERIDNRYADNQQYIRNIRYSITVIYKDPDDDLPIRISELSRIRHDRSYTADNLHHDVFTIYY